MAWQYIAMTRNNLSIIWISLPSQLWIEIFYHQVWYIYNDFEEGSTIQSAGELQKFAKQKKSYDTSIAKICIEIVSSTRKKQLIFINEIFPLLSNLNSNGK